MQDRTIKTEDAEPFSVRVFFFSEETGDHGTSTESEDIAEGDHQGKNRCAERDTCHKIGVAGPGNKVSIYHIMTSEITILNTTGSAIVKKAFGTGAFSKISFSIWKPPLIIAVYIEIRVKAVIDPYCYLLYRKINGQAIQLKSTKNS